jgi:hypothetical protein
MSKPTDRFVIETRTGTVTHMIDTDSDESETDSGVSLSFSTNWWIQSLSSLIANNL